MDKELEKLIIEKPNDVVFLCGAGISLDAPTSLPTVNTFIFNILKECGISNATIDKVYEVMDEANYRFESLIDEIRKSSDPTLLLTKLFNSSSFNKIHHFLSLMLKSGASIITTNFDNCIENACSYEDYDFKNNRFVYNGEDLADNTMPLSNVLVKIHGSHPIKEEAKGELVITISALAKTEKAFKMFPNWRECFLNLLSKKTLVVMGYSCSDDFDIVPLLAQSNPKSVIWLNFNKNELLPKPTDKILNDKIFSLSKEIPVLYFDGQLVPFLLEWSNKLNLNLCEGEKESQFTVKEYISLLNDTQKHVLCNEILLSYGLYNNIVVLGENPQLYLQEIKAQFRLGNYNHTIQLCEKMVELEIPISVKLQTFYYYSSSLYYECDYEGSLDKCEMCMMLALENKDTNFYLNSLINYASIQYVYASTLADLCEQEKLLDDSKQKYLLVQKNAAGINIEAQANALWGLGDLERYKGNTTSALNLYQDALDILKKIGNAYAIDQLENIIKNINIA